MRGGTEHPHPAGGVSRSVPDEVIPVAEYPAGSAGCAPWYSTVRICSRPCGSTSVTITSTGLIGASRMSGHRGRCPSRSPNPQPSHAWTPAETTDSADSSTNTIMSPDQHGRHFRHPHGWSSAAVTATASGPPETTADHFRGLATEQDHEVMARTTAGAICTLPGHAPAAAARTETGVGGLNGAHRSAIKGQPNQDHRTGVRVTDVS